VSTYLYLAWDLLYVFTAILYALMAFHKRRTAWGGRAYTALVIVCAALYLDKIAAGLTRGLWIHGAIQVVWRTLGVLIAPLLIHLFYHNEKEHIRWRRLWKAVLAVMYAVTALFVMLALAGRGNALREILGFGLMLTAAAGGCALLGTSRRNKTSPLDRNQNRWLIGLCGIWLCLILLDAMFRLAWLGPLTDTLPLIFLLVVTYYVERFTFFDVLIKRGAFVFCSYLFFTLYFAFVPPWLLPWTTRAFRNNWFGTLVWAASIWPAALAAPWAHRGLSAWLDRRCLGRRFTHAEAGKYFLTGLEGAIDVRELVERAGRHLGIIFQSVAEVRMEQPAECPGDGMEAPIRAGGEVVGAMIVRPRPHNLRFLSEDAALLASLAEVFSFLLENLRLREKRMAQEQREGELILNAQRSELKALRAQINPHFLFNALNTIAGLIPRNPDRAEQTIEQLAEVFRYTLRRSDREWVRLDDELAAVRAYLDIEQTRFRERLTVVVNSSDGARNWRIPAMTVQTLVENAVKHGVAEITGPAVVEIQAQVAGCRLRIEVRDNGPGFPPAGGRSAHTRPAGYGLRNVRERLEGHFGGDASLAIERDTAQGMTVVRMEMPEVRS
jgi:hypothetical protein